MTDGTYTGDAGAYTGDSGTYTTIQTGADQPPEVFDTFEWGGPLRDRYEIKSPDGEIHKDAAYHGKYGVRSGNDRFLVWAHPSNVYDEQNRKPRDRHEYHPKMGDEMGSLMRFTSITDDSTWVGFPLGFGQTWTYHWHRYTVNPVYRDRFRVVCWTRDGYNIVADSGKGAVDWSTFINQWLVFVTKWYHPDHDGRTGVRALFFDAKDFPFDSWSLADYDAGNLSVTAYADIDTADHPSYDGHKWFNTENRHKFGFGATNNCAADFDDIMLFDRP